MNLVSTPLLPEGFKVPASRNEAPSKRLRRLLAEKPYVFAPGVYDPMGAQLVMYHGFDAVYFSGYSFAIGHLGTTDMDIYSSTEISYAVFCLKKKKPTVSNRCLQNKQHIRHGL